MRSAFALVLLTASAAAAQSITLDYAFQESDKYTFNQDACAAKVQVTWTTSVTLGFCSELRLWSTAGECGDNAATGDVSYDSVSTVELSTQTGTFDVTLAELPGLKGANDAGVACGTEAVEVPHRICGSFGLTSGTLGSCTTSRATSLSMTYDAKPPVAPVLGTIGALDSALKVDVTASADTSIVHVDVRPFGEAEFTEKGRLTSATATSVTLTNLDNGTTYDIRARAEDGAGNFSSPSELASGTPQKTFGFFARYHAAGGGERGCAVAGGMPLAIAVGLWILRRKRG